MDFKSKGRTWVGNIYHKFEAICQDVDDFVTKDTVKYVENQVQSVGEGVKKMYANVLHDLLPPMANNEQSQFQASKTQIDAIENFARSAVGIEDFPQKPNAGLNLEDSGKNAIKEKHSIHRDLGSGDGHSSFDDRKEDSLAVRLNSVESNEYPLIVTSNSPENKSAFESAQISDLEGCTSITATESSAETLIEVVELETNQTCKTVGDGEVLPQEEDSGLSLKPDCLLPFYQLSEMGAQRNAANEDIPVFEATCSVEGKDSSGLSFHIKEEHLVPVDLCILEDKNSTSRELPNLVVKENQEVEECTVRVQGSFPKDVCSYDLWSTRVHEGAEDLDPVEGTNFFKASLINSDGDLRTDNLSMTKSVDGGLPREGESLSRMFSNVWGTNLSSDTGSSSFSSKSKYVNKQVASSSCSLSSFSFLPLGSCTQIEQGCNLTDCTERASTISSISLESFSDLAFDNKVGVLNPSSSTRPLLEVYNDTCGSARTIPFDESFGDKYKRCCRASQLESDMFTSNSGTTVCGDDFSAVDIDDSNMETIDLTDKVKLEESPIMVDNGLDNAASYRPRRFRSYKRMIQDAFASKKRLIKEYERLTIFYGDIDAETSLQPEQRLVHPVTAAALRATALPTCDSCESEWELV